MFELLFDFVLIYFKEIILYFSWIVGILLILALFFINIYKEFLLNKFKLLLNNNLNLIILILTFFLFLLLLLCVFYLLLFYFYIIYKYSNNTFDFVSLWLITFKFDNNTIKIIFIIFILNYIILLYWFYCIFIYKDKKFNYIFIILLYILYLFIIVSIILYNIKTVHAMFDFNIQNSIFTINLQNYKNYNFITLNMLENQELLNKALKLKYHLVTDTKEIVLCYNNKNDLYNLNFFKNMNYVYRNVIIDRVDSHSEHINIENCKCIFLKINYNK